MKIKPRIRAYTSVDGCTRYWICRMDNLTGGEGFGFSALAAYWEWKFPGIGQL